MKKIRMLSALVIPCFLYGMDVSKNTEMVLEKGYFRPINADVEKRHDTLKWQRQLTDAVIFNHKNQVPLLLVQVGNDASELVCTTYSVYGPILRATYIENKPEMRNLLRKYMDAEYCKQCFNLEKTRLHQIWHFNASQTKFITTRPAAEDLVRDFYREDPIKYPLTQEECKKLGIGKIGS